MKNMKKMDMESEAKMAVLEELRDLVMELMRGKYSDKMGDMKEISVAAPDQEGLSKGLDMAKELMEGRDMQAMADEDRPEMSEDDEEEDEEEIV